MRNAKANHIQIHNGERQKAMNINVTKSSLPPYEEYCEELKSLWDSHWLTNMGEKHQKLETALKDYLGAE